MELFSARFSAVRLHCCNRSVVRAFCFGRRAGRRIRPAAVALLFALACEGCGATHHSALALHDRPADRVLSGGNPERLRALWSARQRSEGEGDYVIAAGDLLVVTIYNFRPEGSNFEAEVRVDDGGYISLPTIDPVLVAGLTTAQMRKALADALQRSQVINQPLVSVFLKDHQGQGVIVLGAVARPGLYHLSRGGQTLIDVLSMAGGLTQNAGNYLLLLPAESPGSAGAHASPTFQKAALTATGASSGSEPQADADMIVISAHPGSADLQPLALPMRSGDQVIVPEAGQAFIEGEVAKPGPIPLAYGMTLNQLISAAGGLSYPADRRHVRLVRSAMSGDSTQWEVDLDPIRRQDEPDILLERNDRVVVPATTGRKVAYGVYQLLSRAINFTVGGFASVY